MCRMVLMKLAEMYKDSQRDAFRCIELKMLEVESTVTARVQSTEKTRHNPMAQHGSGSTSDDGPSIDYA